MFSFGVVRHQEYNSRLRKASISWYHNILPAKFHFNSCHIFIYLYCLISTIFGRHLEFGYQKSIMEYRHLHHWVGHPRKHGGSRWNFVDMSPRTRDRPGGQIPPPPPVAGLRYQKTVAGTRVKRLNLRFFYDVDNIFILKLLKSIN